MLRGTLSYGHDLLVKRFIDAVLGRGPLPVTAQDGVAIVRTLESIVTLGQTNGRHRH